MQTHEQLISRLMQRPGVSAEVQRIERDEGVLLDALLKARQEAGLTQAQGGNWGQIQINRLALIAKTQA